MRRSLLVGAFAALGVLAAALPASACSCAMGDPRDQFDAAEAAIVGEYVGARPSEDQDEYEAIYTFNVQEEWKVDFGETLDVYSAENGAACGIEASPGQSVGLFLSMEGDEWHSNLCAQTSPRSMRDASSPLPEPNGSGAPRMVVGGSFGKARVMSLDARGRTLAYGFGGNHDAFQLDACPGGKRFVEIWYDFFGDAERGFAVRRVSDLRVVSEMKISIPQSQDLSGLDCRNSSASSVYLFAGPGYGTPDGSIYDLGGGRMMRLHKDLPARAAEFGERHAFLTGKRNLTRMNLESGRSETILKISAERSFGDIAVSPTGSHVAVIVNGSYEPVRDTKVALIRLSDGRVGTKEVSEGVGYGSLEWTGARRLAALMGAQRGSRLFDLKLDTVRKLAPWYSGADAVSFRGTIWGAAYGELLKMALSGGDVQRDRRLPSPVNYALIEIPKATRD